MRVEVDSGPLLGTRVGNDVFSFKGVPFAAPPLGELRWRPPHPPNPWSEPRDCTAFGPACPQPRNRAFDTPLRQNEDCLHLNVWTPTLDASARLPVMVWLHGGGHVTGTGTSLAYDGQHFARLGVVLITINYRLGPLGYLALPALSRESTHSVSGNYGELDMLAALRWVQNNVRNFGGDPDCVTLFGESAGAASVARLMTSPLAAGLFHRAICQSGGRLDGNRTLRGAAGNREAAEEQGVRIAKQLGCDPETDLARLRGLPVAELLAATNPAQGPFAAGERFGPVVDGWLYPEDAARAFAAGRQLPLPLLVGSNADEGTLFLSEFPERDLDGYRNLLGRYFHDADLALRLFPCASAEEIPAALNRVIAAATFACPARSMANAVAAIGKPAYLYQFARVPNTERGRRDGAYHALELLYVFGSGGRLRGMEDVDRALANKMTAYWANFSRTGDPNGASLPFWPAWCSERQQHLKLDLEPSVQTRFFEAACNALRHATS